MKKRFTEAQIVGFLREADAGVPVKDLCRKHGFSEASYYLWRSKFGGMSVSDANELARSWCACLTAVVASVPLHRQVTVAGRRRCRTQLL